MILLNHSPSDIWSLIFWLLKGSTHEISPLFFKGASNVGTTCTLNVAHQLVEIELQMFYYTRHIYKL